MIRYGKKLLIMTQTYNHSLRMKQSFMEIRLTNEIALLKIHSAMVSLLWEAPNKTHWQLKINYIQLLKKLSPLKKWKVANIFATNN